MLIMLKSIKLKLFKNITIRMMRVDHKNLMTCVRNLTPIINVKFCKKTITRPPNALNVKTNLHVYDSCSFTYREYIR